MKSRGWGWLLLAATALFSLGCASTDAARSADNGTTGGFHGGQTGSLRPCTTPAQFTDPDGQLPLGDTAFVFHSGCTDGDAFSVLDENGEPVPFQLEEVDDGVLLVRTESALEPGSYTITAPDGTVRSVTVTEPEPLPTVLGVASRPLGVCSNLVQLDLAPEVLPYTALLKLEFSLDGGPLQVWFEYGTLPPGEAPLSLALGDLDNGQHRVSIVGSLAGEESRPDPVDLEFEVECADSAPAGDCALGRRAPGEGSATSYALGCLVFLIVSVRRRRRHAKGTAR